MAADPRGDREDADRRAGSGEPRCRPNWFRLAAAVLLVLATSFVTYYVTRQSMQPQVAQIAPEAVPAPQVIGQPASFSFGPERLGAGYMNARAELDKRFQQRIAALPPATAHESRDATLPTCAARRTRSPRRWPRIRPIRCCRIC